MRNKATRFETKFKNTAMALKAANLSITMSLREKDTFTTTLTVVNEQLDEKMIESMDRWHKISGLEKELA